MLITEGRHRLTWILFRQATIGENPNHEDNENTQATKQPSLPSLPAPLRLLRYAPLG
jgi:hypothetical protein